MANKRRESFQQDFFQPLEERRMMAVDLKITGISVDPAVTSAGQSFTITYFVKNLGTTATNQTIFIRNYLSVDDVLGNADDIGLDTEAYKQSIAPGATATVKAISGTGLPHDE